MTHSLARAIDQISQSSTGQENIPPTKYWIYILSENSANLFRAVTYINKRRDILLHLSIYDDLANNVLVAVKMNSLLVNIYNQSNNWIVSKEGLLVHYQSMAAGTTFGKTTITEDFNFHHPGGRVIRGPTEW